MATRPQPPWGYHVCATTPAHVLYQGEGGEETNVDWKIEEYIGEDDTFIYYKYVARDGSDSFWAFPDEVDCSSPSKAATTDTLKDRIKQVQGRLNLKYKDHQYYPLAVDGVWGPKTCFAAYSYQKKVVDYSGSTLLGAFFVALGLPEVWKANFGSSCTSWYLDTPPSGGGTTVTEEPAPPVTAAAFPWKHILLGAAGGALVGAAAKKSVLKKSRARLWQTSVAGALVGALGGFVASKL